MRLKPLLLSLTALLIVTGCATRLRPFPAGAVRIGGGLNIEWEAPRHGTVVLMEEKSGKIIATQSLEPGDSFDFGPQYSGFEETLSAVFPDGAGLPTNAVFGLYFSPMPVQKD
jgi:hypothetical protein